MNDIYGLYCTCPECPNGTIRYVGQTSEGAKTRFYKHCYNARNGKPWPVYRWMAKHGVDNIRYRVLEEVGSPGELDEAERKWIDHYNTLKPGTGYNLWPGGGSVRGVQARARRQEPKKRSEALGGDKREDSEVHVRKEGRIFWESQTDRGRRDFYSAGVP